MVLKQLKMGIKPCSTKREWRLNHLEWGCNAGPNEGIIFWCACLNHGVLFGFNSFVCFLSIPSWTHLIHIPFLWLVGCGSEQDSRWNCSFLKLVTSVSATFQSWLLPNTFWTNLMLVAQTNPPMNTTGLWPPTTAKYYWIIYIYWNDMLYIYICIHTYIHTYIHKITNIFPIP